MFRSLIKTVLKSILWMIDEDHRQKSEIDMDDMKKFTHVVPQNFRSDFGQARNAFRTVPYEVWKLTTTTKTLFAADKHRIIREDGSCAWLEDLKPGDRIITDKGIEQVLDSKSLGFRCHMYCLEVESDNPQDERNHQFFTDGILSHNTTVAAGYLLWKAMFTADSTILITANTYAQALEIMDRIRYAYENLPDHIRAGVRDYNKGTVSFDNGSKIVSRATTPNSGRGLAITLLYCDEMAFLHPNIGRQFFTSILPTLSTGGSCIITSTPKNDEDQFAEIWKGAIDNTDAYGNLRDDGRGRNGFYPILVPWSEHPDRDQAWADEQMAALGEQKFRQEHACEFVSDDETLINPIILSNMSGKSPEFYTGTVRWFKDPDPNHQYLVSLDPSLGVGRDSAAIQVFQLPELIQVAEWAHNATAPRNQVRILMQTLLYIYGTLRDDPNQRGEPELYWSIENNTIGEAILQIIEDTGEDRFPGYLVSERKRKGVSRGRFRKGLTTTPRGKLSACARLKSLIESNRMTIFSSNLIKEFKNFVSTENSFKAKPGEHDDLVSATLLIVRMLDTVLASGEVADADLREYIDDEELEGEGEGMPMVI